MAVDLNKLQAADADYAKQAMAAPKEPTPAQEPTLNDLGTADRGHVSSSMIDGIVNEIEQWGTAAKRVGQDAAAGVSTAAGNITDAVNPAHAMNAAVKDASGGQAPFTFDIPIWDHAKNAIMNFRDSVAVKDPNIVDNLAQGAAQLVGPFAAYSKALSGLKGFANTVAAGAATDVTALGPHDMRTADLIRLGQQTDTAIGSVLRDLGPYGLNAYVNFLADRGGPDVSAYRVTPGNAAANPDSWGKRADGSAKGPGFLGVLQRSDGSVSSEISVGVNINGKETDVPALVPSLSKEEVDWLMTHDPGKEQIPDSIVQKASSYAKDRIASGKSPFAGPGEQVGPESEAEGRFKNALDGLGANMVVSPLIHAAGIVVKQGTAALKTAASKGVSAVSDLIPETAPADRRGPDRVPDDEYFGLLKKMQAGTLSGPEQVKLIRALNQGAEKAPTGPAAEQPSVEETRFHQPIKAQGKPLDVGEINGPANNDNIGQVSPLEQYQAHMRAAGEILGQADPESAVPKGWGSTEGGGGSPEDGSSLNSARGTKAFSTVLQATADNPIGAPLSKLSNALQEHLPNDAEGNFYREVLQRISGNNPETQVFSHSEPYSHPVNTGGEPKMSTHGLYRRTDDTLHIYPGAFRNPARLTQVFTHEAVHAVTVKTMDSSPRVLQDFQQLTRQASDAVAPQGGTGVLSKADQYGFKNPYEFVAEIEANPRFRKAMQDTRPLDANGNPAKSGPTIWDLYKDKIAGILGVGGLVSGSSLFDKLLTKDEGKNGA